MNEAQTAFEQHWYMSNPTPEYLKAKEFFVLGYDRGYEDGRMDGYESGQNDAAES